MKNEFNAKAQRREGAEELNSFTLLCDFASSRLGVEFPH
jgi:hypothetical protein